MREFLEGQKAQNVLHSEVTYTASTVERRCGIPWPEQRAALLRGIRYGEGLGVTCGLILDVVRGDPVARAMEVAEWATTAEGVVALGLAGEERLGTRQYAPAVALAAERGLPWVPHAGETTGAATIWECLEIGAPAASATASAPPRTRASSPSCATGASPWRSAPRATSPSASTPRSTSTPCPS